MVQRKGEDIIIPVGDTLILKDDKIIMIEAEDALEFPRYDENNVV